MIRIGEALPSKRRWLIGGVLMFLAWVALSVWTPGESRRQSICFFRVATGVPCPSCGMTRGFAALAKGDVSAAFDKHPLAPLFAFELMLGWLVWGAAAWKMLPFPSMTWVNAGLLLHGALLLTVWVYRLSAGALTIGG